jgi:DNA (cytosine-5)-methyltransferase 1
MIPPMGDTATQLRADINLVRRPRILDLYCGQGGAAVGYYLAGFDVIGLDKRPQPQYPFPIIRGDGLAALRDDGLLDQIDAIHASPPCQSESQLRFLTRKNYVDLLTPTLELLDDLIDIPWIVENVETTAKMPGSIVLCGTHFNLGVPGRALKRHRRFSASFPLPDPGPCWCAGQPTGGVYGHLSNTGIVRGFSFGTMEARRAMGIDWMSRQGLAQAIPPDYTRWIGEQLISRYFPHTGSRDYLHDRYSSGRKEQFAKL